MAVRVIRAQGVFELLGLGLFLGGYFAHIGWLTVAGGVLVVLDDTIEVAIGTLKPLFPVILAVALALVFTPWYVGVFWASAAFRALGAPTSFIKVFAPKKVVAKAIRQHPELGD